MTSTIARLGFLVLAVGACVNLASGATLALQDPHRASDLLTVYDWCHRWWFGGQSLYTGPDAAADYPPNAIVMLSPLALVPWPWLVPLWTAGALLLTPVLPYLVIRSVSRGDRSTIAVPVLLFLCWTGTRTLLQFSLLSMTLSFLALRFVDSHRIASGVLLGLALFKPHIAGPIALWTIVTGRARVALVAAAVVLAGWAAYDARIGEKPLATLEGYFFVLGAQYGGVGGLVGNTSIRAWTTVGTGDPRVADALWIGTSGLLLIGVWWLARRDPGRALEAGGLAVPGLFGLWSLLAFYHNSNNLIMMLPAFVFLWSRESRGTSPWRWWPIVCLQAALTFDVPTRVIAYVPEGGWAHVAVRDFDRVLVLATFVCVAGVWYRLTDRPALS